MSIFGPTEKGKNKQLSDETKGIIFLILFWIVLYSWSSGYILPNLSAPQFIVDNIGWILLLFVAIGGSLAGHPEAIIGVIIIAILYFISK